MYYISTRDRDNRVSASYAIAHGISKEGGLFVPEAFPALTEADFNTLKNLSYHERAKYIFKLFLSDFSDEQIDNCVKNAYLGRFDNDLPAPLKSLDNNLNVLELWHGPTSAFKDLALQILPHLLTTSLKNISDNKKSVILVATSGDTGKAALEGFKDVKNTEILVFYPVDGVSDMQKLQMVSQTGNNVHVTAIRGNFDDAQSAVKTIFTDSDFIKLLADNNMEFSSANSINWGRLCPQIVYYVSAYLDLLRDGVHMTDGFNVCVPTGNFGNILAAYYAKKIGVPIAKLICASNKNCVLTDFFESGTYNRNREFYLTTSPSMDILISSNLERLLFELTDGDDAYVSSLIKDLTDAGVYTVNDAVKSKMNEYFYAAFTDDTTVDKIIKSTFEKYNYLIDTHTAVAFGAYNKYLSESNDDKPVVIASTASPYKFYNSVLKALGKEVTGDKFADIDFLSEYTGTKIPAPIAGLKNAKIRFTDVYGKDEIFDAVRNELNL